MPTPEGYCPSCVRVFTEATRDQTDFEVATVPRYPSSPRVDFWIKLAIVLVVFPTFCYLTSIVAGLALMVILLPFPDDVLHGLEGLARVAATVLGVVGGILISRKIWPKAR